MKLLLDTHPLLGAVGEPKRPRPPRVGRSSTTATACVTARRAFGKLPSSALGRGDFRAEPGILRRSLLENSYTEVPAHSDHAVAVGVLPLLHKDPFDRILLVTADARLAEYPGPIRKVWAASHPSNQADIQIRATGAS